MVKKDDANSVAIDQPTQDKLPKKMKKAALPNPGMKVKGSPVDYFFWNGDEENPVGYCPNCTTEFSATSFRQLERRVWGHYRYCPTRRGRMLPPALRGFFPFSRAGGKNGGTKKQRHKKHDVATPNFCVHCHEDIAAFVELGGDGCPHCGEQVR